MRRILLAALAVLALPAAASASPDIWAHRGGALVDGQPAYPENTLPAFQNAAAEGFGLEFDVHVTKDGVPVVIHDDTLDRVTDCKGLGPIHTLSLAQVRACPVTWIGRPGDGAAARAPEPAPVPTLAEVLQLAADTGASIAPEIKNLPPTDQASLQANDFDPTPAFATAVATALRDGPVPQSRIVVQSFWPPNLHIAQALLSDAHMSLLTLKQMNEGGPAYATASGWEWFSPDSTAVTADTVARAHALGRRVIPYTPNSPAEFTALAADGVDALITDDPSLARSTLQG